jgi:acetyl esterase/lipase
MSRHILHFPKLILFLLFIVAIGNVSAQTGTVYPLWKDGAPGFESRRAEPETAKDWWVKNIHNPNITVFPAPADKATGAAMLICPGGGHRALVYNSEGRDAALFLNSIGVTAIVLKYRLFREEGSVYTEINAKQDVFRAMRQVRAMAAQWNIDTSRIGILGFSAGGELAGWLSYAGDNDYAVANDAIDKLSARPAFQVLVYPGPLAVPKVVETSAPSSFLVAANDDTCCSEPVVQLLRMHRQAKVPVEAHIYALGDHAFNMGKRTTFQSIRAWPARLTEWLHDNKISIQK